MDSYYIDVRPRECSNSIRVLTNVNILGAAPVERTAPEDKDTVLPPVWFVALDCVPLTIVPFNWNSNSAVPVPTPDLDSKKIQYVWLGDSEISVDPAVCVIAVPLISALVARGTPAPSATFCEAELIIRALSAVTGRLVGPVSPVGPVGNVNGAKLVGM